ncbi:hypothetical protein ISF_05718 [Cordyceps fumosorosea ARSEF 2679]|uniref:Uncharacterized protein n=1 Tax=Cordyceps fumosorosea (strain ARSEF 2679) TaxID=1081104 RepID=A0A167TK05_CORFA|nr:hypothetical protein ISF_05718 [Cordyceps fumosorosea ARSEF 2679]OAA60679.1 hypothetical protein ISF_05718 [Cordyceps fumosorosea ARSEF 2679]
MTAPGCVACDGKGWYCYPCPGCAGEGRAGECTTCHGDFRTYKGFCGNCAGWGKEKCKTCCGSGELRPDCTCPAAEERQRKIKELASRWKS